MFNTNTFIDNLPLGLIPCIVTTKTKVKVRAAYKDTTHVWKHTKYQNVLLYHNNPTGANATLKQSLGQLDTQEHSYAHHVNDSSIMEHNSNGQRYLQLVAKTDDYTSNSYYAYEDGTPLTPDELDALKPTLLAQSKQTPSDIMCRSISIDNVMNIEMI